MIRLSAFSDEADSSLLGQIQALKRNDIFFTELRTVNSKNVADFTEGESKEFKKALKESLDKGVSLAKAKVDALKDLGKEFNDELISSPNNNAQDCAIISQMITPGTTG